MLLIVAAVLAVIFWRYLLLAGFGMFAWKVLSVKLLGRRGRRSPTFARNVQALALAYASWQTRKLGGGGAAKGRTLRRTPSPGMKAAAGRSEWPTRVGP